MYSFLLLTNPSYFLNRNHICATHFFPPTIIMMMLLH